MLTVVVRLAEIAASVVVALGLAILITTAISRAGPRLPVLFRLASQSKLPLRTLAVFVATYLGIGVAAPHTGWASFLRHVTALACIAAAAWLATNLLFVVEDAALTRFRTDVSDNRHARAIHTQVTVARRLTAVTVTLIAIAAMLTTFREARLVGASLLASAGVAAAIAAFAANTLLANVVAGLQIAFGGSVRLDDVVVIEEEWGRIEEITLTYVVVHLWDDRRLILPTTYLTTRPFANWTRSQSSLIGAVTLDVDWGVSLDQMRDALRDLLSGTQLWDGRVSVVQAIDASFGRVTVRALVSAADAPTLWDLRCVVREGLITWVCRNDGQPRLRANLDHPSPHPAPLVPPARSGDDRVFSGDRRAQARGDAFTGPHAS